MDNISHLQKIETRFNTTIFNNHTVLESVNIFNHLYIV